MAITDSDLMEDGVEKFIFECVNYGCPYRKRTTVPYRFVLCQEKREDNKTRRCIVSDELRYSKFT